LLDGAPADEESNVVFTAIACRGTQQKLVAASRLPERQTYVFIKIKDDLVLGECGCWARANGNNNAPGHGATDVFRFPFGRATY
jgi:hypothetical protein